MEEQRDLEGDPVSLDSLLVSFPVADLGREADFSDTDMDSLVSSWVSTSGSSSCSLGPVPSMFGMIYTSLGSPLADLSNRISAISEAGVHVVTSRALAIALPLRSTNLYQKRA